MLNLPVFFRTHSRANRHIIYERGAAVKRNSALFDTVRLKWLYWAGEFAIMFTTSQQGVGHEGHSPRAWPCFLNPRSSRSSARTGNNIVLMNPAAVSAFGDHRGAEFSALLPEAVRALAPGQVAAVTLCGKRASLRAASAGGLTVYFAAVEAPAPALPERRGLPAGAAQPAQRPEAGGGPPERVGRGRRGRREARSAPP